MKFLIVLCFCLLSNGWAVRFQSVKDKDETVSSEQPESNDISSMLIKIYEKMIELQTRYGEVKDNEKKYEIRLAQTTAQLVDVQKRYDIVKENEKKFEIKLGQMTTQLSDWRKKYDTVESKMTSQIDNLQNEMKEKEKHYEAKISELEKKYKGVDQKEKKQDADIANVKTTTTAQVSDLQRKYTEVKALEKQQEANLNSINSRTTAQINDLQRKYTQVSVPKWAGGSYCILANGVCPPGFARFYGHMLAINQYDSTPYYIRQAKFGDSSIKCHGNCGQYEHWIGELHLTTCCK